MKAAPICVQSSNSNSDKEKIRQLINPGRDEDNFIFGSHYNRWVSEEKEEKEQEEGGFEGMTSLQRAMAKAKISKKKDKTRSAKDEKAEIENKWILRNCDCVKVRTDDDGIKILPSHVLRELIFL